MKFVRLDLTAFGPFTDRSLELDAGQEGLHVIYGPNEAGKTSMLRALKQFLYGIGHKSPDNFVHPYPRLRIGAVLRAANGTLLELTRRKAAKNDLRDASDAVVDPAVLSRHLGGADLAVFETMFGIDHAALLAGGKAILEGTGQLGQALFAAGSGVARLRAVQQAIDAECEDLFAPRARNKTINKRLSDWEQARKAVTAAQLPSAQWSAQDQALREATDRLGWLDVSLSAAAAERNRLARIEEALPLAAHRNALAAQLDALIDARLLGLEFSRRRYDAAAAWRGAMATAQRAEESIRAIDAQQQQLGSPDSILDHADQVEQLREALAVHQKAQSDLPGIVAQGEALGGEARRLLRTIAPDLPLDQVESLRLTRLQQAAIQDLANYQAALATARQEAETQRGEAASSLAAARRSAESLEAPRDVRTLAAAVRRAQSHGRLDEELAAARAELQTTQSAAQSALARLPLWSGSLDDLLAAPLPATETIERFDAQMADAQARLNDLAGQLGRAESRLADIVRRLDQLRMSGDVPSEAALTEARRRRDDGWRLVKELWRTGRLDSSEAQAYAAAGGTLVEAYELAVRTCDELADRLRREADRVATRAGLESDAQATSAEIERLRNERQIAQQQLKQSQGAWEALWNEAAVQCLTPREMRGWVAARHSIVQQAEAATACRLRCLRLQELCGAVRDELSGCLESLDQPPAGAGETLAQLTQRSLDLVEHSNQAAEACRRAADEIRELESRAEKTRIRFEAADAQSRAWSEQWANALVPLKLMPDAKASQVQAVLAGLEELFQKLETAETFRERARGISAESQRFAEATASLAGACGLDAGSLTPVAAARALVERHRKASQAAIRRQALETDKQQAVEQRAAARRDVEAARAILAGLCQEAGCETPEELPEIERRSDELRRLRQEASALDQQLQRLAGGGPLDEFVRQVQQVDTDAVKLRISQLASQIEAWETEKTECNRAIGGHERDLAAMDTHAAAAEAAEQVESLAAQLRDDVGQYCRLRLASGVLHRAVEHYRSKHQSTLITRAGQLFAELTCGAFARLDADYDQEGSAVLVGVRPGVAAGSARIGVEAMSQGTVDQLYLALRLASLEEYLERNEPMPFIVDDILIQFDNDRSAATMAALGRLSRRTQVIFFTHHEHLVELAEKNLPGEVLFVHRLDALRAATSLAGPLA